MSKPDESSSSLRAPEDSFINTSIRVERELLTEFRRIVKAADPETDTSKEVRKFMRARIAEQVEA